MGSLSCAREKPPNDEQPAIKVMMDISAKMSLGGEQFAQGVIVECTYELWVMELILLLLTDHLQCKR